MFLSLRQSVEGLQLQAVHSYIPTISRPIYKKPLDDPLDVRYLLVVICLDIGIRLPLKLSCRVGADLFDRLLAKSPTVAVFGRSLRDRWELWKVLGESRVNVL
mmetsp:Transcript_18747/g.33999  ORF Transcript_18747/g.33999 Transcript_18747/m.33999 type:complete len:103 (+) Transcript_18747:1079-1387(+)